MKTLEAEYHEGFSLEYLREWVEDLGYKTRPSHERALALSREWVQLGICGNYVPSCMEVNWIFTEMSGYIPEFDRASKASSKEEILQLIEDVRAGRNELRILLHKAGVYGGSDYGFVNLFIDLGLMSYSSAYIGLEEAIQYTFEVLLEKIFQMVKDSV